MLNTYLATDLLNCLRVEAYKLWAKMLPPNPTSSLVFLFVHLFCFELALAAAPYVEVTWGSGIDSPGFSTER